MLIYKEFSGSDWYGQVWRDGSRWVFAVAFSFDGERVASNVTGGYLTAVAAERGLRALVRMMEAERLKVWAAAAGVSVGVLS